MKTGEAPKIWRIALWKADVSVVSITTDDASQVGNGLPPKCEVVQRSGASTVALACKEASIEWTMISCCFSEYFPVNMCLERTICPLQGIPHSGAEPARGLYAHGDMIPRIQHVAFLVLPNVNLMGIFIALSNIPCLETVTVVIPPHPIEGVGHLGRHEVSQIARALAELADEPATGSQDGKFGHVGLLLRGDPPSQAVRVFYSRRDAPRVKLLTPRCSQPSLHDPMLRSSSPGFSLIHYA
ncbi:uncharacterized protein NECHADRAFT_88497 [Fusarium vanettenii 77-13-4]|uniref:Uncharacterized protein n=1 Tax=Fusarium vanettenii (strain ATCC MYA-4622 / CBS 123669 / FGSC 9596 / NRRL 45880 / 77-13-4) TaxID=660122 RepID=C7ZBR0_FUSV7|nr:uncharacterized protein NECHADRAFT_88497 [Fusarium vanettenii 77-13-4]EEU38561.1 predicted protein [Fusarium vanettenii 77-13-4]